jgi:hypothetical protein
MAAINDACLGDSLTGFICLELSLTHIPSLPGIGSLMLKPPGIVSPLNLLAIILMKYI